MRIIDAHQHFWKYNIQNHGWINEDMRLIQRDFLPEDLAKILIENQVQGCISVQVDQTMDETAFQVDCAKKNDFIKGVVGWIDLMDPQLENTLQSIGHTKSIKGFRHILQGTEKGFMLNPGFISGLQKIAAKGYSYDLLIYHHQFSEAIQLLDQVNTVPVVLDHIGKPNIKAHDIKDWSQQIKEIAKFDNVYCKISGLATEADWTKWKSEDLHPYLAVIIESFGFDRIMFGSDWPVCLVSTSYERWLNLLKEYFSAFTNLEQTKFFALNCERFYKLNN